MNEFKKGDEIIYTGATIEQIQWGNNSDPRKILFIGKTYHVADVEVHSQHTKLTLSGISGKFNSVSFEKL